MPADFVRDRATMEKHIQAGGSVLLPDGRNVTRIEDLPDESTLAGQDVDRHQAEVNRLQAEHDATKAKLDAAQKQLDAAQKAQKAAPAPTPPAPAHAAHGGHGGHGGHATHDKGKDDGGKAK